MGRLMTVLCVVTGIVTIVDHIRDNPFYSQWLSRHFVSTSHGWQISPALNFLVLLGLGASVWLLSAAEATPTDPDSARRQTWKRSGLAATAMAAWLGFGPAIRRSPLVPRPANQADAKAPPPVTPFSPFRLKPLDRQGIGRRE